MELRSFLEREHANLVSLLEKLTDTSEGATKTRQKLFEQLGSDLEMHGTIEELHLYPAARTAGLAELARAGEDEHEAIRTLLTEMSALPVDGEAFMQKVEQLADAVEDHVAKEEVEILPQIERALDEAELAAVAGRLQEEKQRRMAVAR